MVAGLPDAARIGDPLACVALAGAQLMLGTSQPEFLPAESRAHKGAGVELHVTVPSADIGAVYEGHGGMPGQSPISPTSVG